MQFNSVTLAFTTLALLLTMINLSFASPVISKDGNSIGGLLVRRSESVDEYIEDNSNAVTS